MTAAVDELERVVAELNRETDQLNAAIEDFEERLEAAGVGCEAWLANTVAGCKLGYAKVAGRWRIAVLRGNDGPTSLLNAPRAARVEACDHLEALADQLLLLARERLEDVRRATETVKRARKP